MLSQVVDALDPASIATLGGVSLFAALVFRTLWRQDDVWQKQLQNAQDERDFAKKDASEARAEASLAREDARNARMEASEAKRAVEDCERRSAEMEARLNRKIAHLQAEIDQFHGGSP